MYFESAVLIRDKLYDDTCLVQTGTLNIYHFHSWKQPGTCPSIDIKQMRTSFLIGQIVEWLDIHVCVSTKGDAKFGFILY